MYGHCRGGRLLVVGIDADLHPAVVINETSSLGDNEVQVSRVKQSYSNFIRPLLQTRIPLSIRSKITLPFLVLAIALAIASGFVITRIVFDTIEERFSNQLIEAGLLAQERMVVEEGRLLTTFRSLAYTRGLTEALAQGDANKIRELIFGTIVNQQEEAVEILDARGNHLLAIRHREGGRVEDYEFSVGGETIAWDFISQILAAEVDDQGDKYSDFVRADWGEYFYVAGPVYNEKKELVGIILVGRTAKTLARQLREETLAQISFYDHDGKVIISTLLSPVDLRAADVQDILALQQNKSLKRDLSVQNIQYQEIMAAWNGRGGDDLGALGASLPTSFLVRATRVTRLQTTILVIITLLVVILIGVNLANIITRPITRLVQASEQVAKGDLHVQLKPSGRDELSVLTETFNQMVVNLRDSKEDLIESYDSTLEGWSKALELRDKETQGHSSRVIDMTVLMAREMGISENQIEFVRRGAMLHDIGKMGIPDSILLKPGKLDEDELNLMRQHVLYAYEMLQPIEFLRPALAIPYCHHEFWDGSGYPRGLKGEEIPLEARIFAVVDTWDALSSNRPYRTALPEEDVIQIIREETGTHFDPSVAEVFLRLISKDAV